MADGPAYQIVIPDMEKIALPMQEPIISTTQENNPIFSLSALFIGLPLRSAYFTFESQYQHLTMPFSLFLKRDSICSLLQMHFLFEQWSEASRRGSSCEGIT